MADEVIRQLAEVVGGDDSAGQLLELVVVDLADGVDEVVEADRGRNRTCGQATTLGCRLTCDNPWLSQGTRFGIKPPEGQRARRFESSNFFSAAFVVSSEART